MTDTYRMAIYDRQGRLWDRIGGTEEELREQGIGFTTNKGQTAWVCHLDLNGKTVAVCRRGEWKNV
jgi:hypothetical protein